MARGAGQPTFEAGSSTATRWWSTVPDRGVRTISGSCTVVPVPSDCSTAPLERRIAHLSRRLADDAGQAPPESVTIRFLERDPGWEAGAVTVAELFPLLVSCRRLVTGSRPLSAVDLRPAAEADADGATDPNPGGVDLVEFTARIDGAASSLTVANDDLVAAAQLLAAGPTPARAEDVRAALVAVADHGVDDAFPHSPVGADPGTVAALLEQAATVAATVGGLLAKVAERRSGVGTDPDAVAGDVVALTEIGRLILGAQMPILPRFRPKNGDELVSADALTLADDVDIEEWWLGLTPVRAPLATFDRVRLLGDGFGRPQLDLQIRQLPVRSDHPWVAGPIDPDDLAEGYHLHLVHSRPPAADPRDPTVGLVLDEWTETIPSRTETTGLAVHVNQPDSEPPQAILVAVPPRAQDNWTWKDLLGTVTDTLDRAKLRAVEPDHLATTALAHLLPAVLTAVATTPLATISMALVASQEAAIAKREEPA